MKYAGKKVGMMPKADVENAADAKKPGDAKEDNTIKKTGSFGGEPNKLGGGGRLKQMVAQGKSPALAAFLGRKLYGSKKMAKMSAAGKSGK